MRAPGMIKRQQKNRIALGQIVNKHKNQQYLQIRQFDQSDQKDRISRKKLTHLDFAKSQLTQIPLEIFENETITHLNFTDNCLAELPRRYLLMKLRFLQTLNLSVNKFKTMVLPKMQSLRVLILDSNYLHSLNVENQPFLKILSCQNNQMDCLSIPLSLQILNARKNELQNLFFICEVGSKKNCLQQVNLESNKLYDVKLIPQQFRNAQKKIAFPNLQKFYLSNNKIIHLDGFQTISNVKQLDMSMNQLSISRSNLNELLKLKNAQDINLLQNPLQQGGYDLNDVKNTLTSKLTKLKFFNKEDVADLLDSESQAEAIKQSPYKLFSDQQTKKQKKNQDNSKLTKLKQWNFTLGDCEESDLSVNQELLSSRRNEISPVLLVTPTELQLNYNEHFRKLLPMSFIAPRPINSNQKGKPVSVRIEAESEQYLIINEMMKKRGGVVYLRKIIIWKNNNFGHFDQLQQFGFYHQQIGQKQFRDISKGICKKEFKKEFIGVQPNMFSCYHLLVRIGRNNNEYGCLYAIQTSHL